MSLLLTVPSSTSTAALPPVDEDNDNSEGLHMKQIGELRFIYGEFCCSDFMARITHFQTCQTILVFFKIVFGLAFCSVTVTANINVNIKISNSEHKSIWTNKSCSGVNATDWNLNSLFQRDCVLVPGMILRLDCLLCCLTWV